MVSDIKRLFLSIPIDTNHKQLCINFINSQIPSDIRWIKEENWHVTSIFIGDFPAHLLQNLNNHLTTYFKTQPFFSLEFDTFLYIPNKSRPRMIWGQFYKNQNFDSLLKGSLKSLKEFYKQENLDFEIKLHKDSIPHITLCRIKKHHYVQSELNLDFSNDLSLTLEVKYCQLYESVLKPQGAEYTMLKEFELLK